MSLSPTFHDMPVYRLSLDAFEDECEKDVCNQLRSLANLVLDDTESRLRNYLFNKLGPWKYNEIVGYIGLHFLGSQVRGEYFTSVKRYLRRSRKKVFQWQDWKLADERELTHPQTDASIFLDVKNYVEECKRNLQKKQNRPKLYVDDSWLQEIGPYIKWVDLWKSKSRGWPGQAGP